MWGGGEKKSIAVPQTEQTAEGAEITTRSPDTGRRKKTEPYRSSQHLWNSLNCLFWGGSLGDIILIRILCKKKKKKSKGKKRRPVQPAGTAPFKILSWRIVRR